MSAIFKCLDLHKFRYYGRWVKSLRIYEHHLRVFKFSKMSVLRAGEAVHESMALFALFCLRESSTEVSVTPSVDDDY